MLRKLGFFGVILTIIGFLIVLFTYPYGLRRGDSTSYFSYDGVNICRVSSVASRRFFTTGQSLEFCVYRVEVDEIPEEGLRVLVGIEFRRRDLKFNDFVVTQQWNGTFFRYKTKTPLKMTIPITGSLTEQDFNLTIGEHSLSIRTYVRAYILLEGNEIQDLGEHSSRFNGHITCYDPMTTFVLSNLLGIGMAVFSAGITMLIGTFVVVCIKRIKKSKSRSV